jgi:anti-sigma regulatory factor (Ser/Thr protein kinase)
MTTYALQHETLPFSGPEGFVTAAAAAVRAARAAGATPVVFADTERLTQLRRTLGSDAAGMLALDRSITGRNPARLIPALQHVADQPDAGRVRCISEPVRAGDTAAVRNEVALHELLLYLPAFRTWNLHLTCAYDTDALDADSVAMIERCHAAPSDPEDSVDRARARPLPGRPVESEELGVDRTTLSFLRGFIQGRAMKAGLDDERVSDLVYAVNEVVTNSICHGEGRARVSVWIEPGAVACEVRDRGWIRDPLAGRVAPRPDRVSGRGLWLVNQLCDLVQLRSSPAGTTLRMHIDV